MSDTLLQTALDFEHMTDAAKIAELLSENLDGAPYICEIGTPLIKNEGLKTLVPEIRRIVGDEATILVDLKTMDTGAFEVGLAHKAGADGVGIAGVAEEKTITSALEAAQKYGMRIEIDSISTEKIPGRMAWIANEINNYNANGGDATLEYHIAIDVQGTKDFSPAKKIYEEFNIPVAVAGGLNAKTIPDVLDYAQICVVGGGITNPKKGTPKDALNEIMGILYKSNNHRNNGHKESDFVPGYVAFET